jgi:hypothetical protein
MGKGVRVSKLKLRPPKTPWDGMKYYDLYKVLRAMEQVIELHKNGLEQLEKERQSLMWFLLGGCMTTKIKGVKCPACGADLELIKEGILRIHCPSCGRDWKTGLIPLTGEMQIPEKFNMQEIIEKGKRDCEDLGWPKEDVKFMGFRLYYEHEGSVMSRGFFTGAFEPDTDT